ncbi:MAG: lysoplasmalogenase family protein [Sediminibacterium sp.]
MESFLHKKALVIYWLVLLLSVLFLYFIPRYTVLTEPLLVPLLLLHLFLRDNNIGKPFGKLVFFIGLFLAFLGDVLQVVINNEVFFISSLVAFMLMNTCYGISFYSLNKKVFRKPWPFLSSCLVMTVIAYWFINFLGDENLGDYKMPLVLYIFTLCLMASLAVNVMNSERYKKIAVNWLIPGAVIFVLQNMLLATNLFRFGGDSKLYIFSVIPYGIAQYLIMKGMQKAYGNIE